MHVASAIPGSAADYRLLYVSVAGSMLLHLAIVIGVQRAPPKEPPPRITATLREVAPPATSVMPAPAVAEPTPSPLVPLPPPPPPKPETRAPTPPDPKKAILKDEVKVPEPRLVAPSAPTAPAPSVALPVAPAEAKPEPKPEARAEARVERDTARQAAPAAPAAPVPAPGEHSERELVGRYQQQLADIIETRKLKRYPNDAMQNNWEGTATVLLKIGTDTKIAGVEIAVSSGHEILDEQARISISRAKPFVQVPEGLKGKMFEARVRVVFSLKN